MDEFSWAVGLFEGEGHIDAVRRRLIVASTDLDVLERFRAAVGCGDVRGPYGGKERHKAIYQWSLARWKLVAPLVEKMEPHLCERRAGAARELLANPAVRPWGGRTENGVRVCREGHPITGDNAQMDKTGRARCRVCNRRAARAAYHAKRAKEAGIR